MLVEVETVIEKIEVLLMDGQHLRLSPIAAL